MKTVSCHRKYPITTNFLDTMLEHSVDIQEGETKLDAYRRGLKELDQIAAELRKEANTQQGSPYQYPAIQQGPPPPEFLNGSLPIISKEKEKVEIAIDNCTSLEELKDCKVAATHHGLTTEYMRKLRDLTAEPPKNFTDGLE